MRKTIVLALLMAVAATAVVAQSGKRDAVAAQRSLLGQVKDAGDAPLPKAVVYLKNTKTLAVRSFITDDSGNYRFHSLSPNVDYEVHAEFSGAKSDVKTLSAFDSRGEAYINLKVPAKR